ncbi:hypothetical protein FEM48_Zijuj02G0032000 [Ziziphus jujuba var. spinosa]|uniref:Alpha-ketoglutarate-dependent dioxygenase AlkB-like domain-containing protein n=1 Tax=Ziziphus jujuba var. spinosa TaxID=714518 RepID=A0A978VTA2_ZIZJJ|nr:hypothetical protein FEM48_Zijuj02G0032000 [Ziziphus jujuba var. spinosa]
MRPGMVLLKHYITYDEQARCEIDHNKVGIIRSCQKLGLGPGGFYQLGNHGHYIMALGLTWDPKRRMYELWRTVDGTKTHDIPEDYSLLVKRSIQDAHAHLKKDLKVTNLEVEDVLPSMSPTVCIVNFYTTLATLALHQLTCLGRSESKGSLQNGLPIVSFSLGDSAEFIYVDVHKVKKVILESGDVLMFGGKSRHIHHGVSSIIPNSAPKQFLEESRLRPGRLNLTFREFQKLFNV